MKKQHLLIGAAVALSALGLSACASGGDSGSAPAPSASGDASLASLVPDEFQGTTLNVVDGDSNPPMYGRDANGEINGITLDLATAAAERLGLTLNVEANSFDASIPGLQSGKYDLSLWATDLTAEREAVIAQIPIGQVGYGFLTSSADAPLDDDMEALCGLNVAAIKGQTTITVLEDQSATCQSDGKDPITVSTFPDQASATLAVKSDRADAATINSVSGVYAAQQDSELQLTGPIFNKHLTGIATSLESGLGDAFAAALQAMVDDGTYAEIVSGYGADSMLIDDISVNPAL